MVKGNSQLHFTRALGTVIFSHEINEIFLLQPISQSTLIDSANLLVILLLRLDVILVEAVISVPPPPPPYLYGPN